MYSGRRPPRPPPYAQHVLGILVVRFPDLLGQSGNLSSVLDKLNKILIQLLESPIPTPTPTCTTTTTTTTTTPTTSQKASSGDI